MDSWQQDMIMIILGWILGLFTLPIAKDTEAKEKCLNRLYEIKRLLKELSDNMRSSTRSEQAYNRLLTEIRPNIEKLNIEKTGLAIPCRMLNDLISSSLVIFRDFDPMHENQAFDTTSTSVNFMTLWGGDKKHRPDFQNIEDIQKFICGSLPIRCIKWFWSLQATLRMLIFKK